ncbi:hypothetical protein D3C87_1644820 [compost metagenome]
MDHGIDHLDTCREAVDEDAASLPLQQRKQPFRCVNVGVIHVQRHRQLTLDRPRDAFHFLLRFHPHQ